MRINFIPQYKNFYSATRITERTPKEPAFCGYFNDPDEYNPKIHDGISYFCEHLEEGEKPKRGQSLFGVDKNIVYNRNCTYFFRNDMNWVFLGHFLRDKFKDEDKVDTRVYACSYGPEAYTFSMLIQKMFPDDFEKFFPIMAKDISEVQIEQNKIRQKGDVKICKGEALSARKALSWGVIDDFCDYIAKNDEGKNILTERVKAPVVFETANILEDIDTIDSEHPAIISCRNMWPYVNSEEYGAFSDKLYKKLKEGSVVIIGEFDYTGPQILEDIGIAESLVQSGFSPVQLFNYPGLRGPIVFEKK